MASSRARRRSEQIHQRDRRSLLGKESAAFSRGRGVRRNVAIGTKACRKRGETTKKNARGWNKVWGGKRGMKLRGSFGMMEKTPVRYKNPRGRRRGCVAGVWFAETSGWVEGERGNKSKVVCSIGLGGVGRVCMYRGFFCYRRRGWENCTCHFQPRDRRSGGKYRGWHGWVGVLLYPATPNFPGPQSDWPPQTWIQNSHPLRHMRAAITIVVDNSTKRARRKSKDEAKGLQVIVQALDARSSTDETIPKKKQPYS